MSWGTVVIGAGGWGTALARLLAKRGPTGLWCREPEVAAQINESRENRRFLPEIRLPEGVFAFTEAALAAKADLVFLAVPVQHLRSTAAAFRPYLPHATPLVSGSKGIEIGSGRLPSQILAQALGREHPILSLSGPSHAEEVGLDQPAAVVIAGTARRHCLRVQDLLNTETFRVYTTRDQIGVEIAGALKNVIALAAGIAEGLGFGDNTRAALATRGLAEITHLGEAMGADARTFSGLAGMGDLFATLASEHSRNHWAGREIGRGRRVEEVIASTQMVIEGIPTCRAALTLVERYRMELPIVERMGAILFGGQDPRAALSDLMQRAPTAEKIPWYRRWHGLADETEPGGHLAGVRRRYLRHRQKLRQS